MKTYINIKRPNKTRATFALVYQFQKHNHQNKRNYKTIENNELDIINENFLLKIHTEDQAYELVKQLRIKLIPPEKAELNYNFSEINNRLILSVRANWGNKITPSTKRTHDLDFARILKLLGPKSLHDYSSHDLQNIIINSKFSESIQNRLIIYVNCLLRAISRKDLLSKIDVEIKTKYLTESDLALLLEKQIKIDQVVTRLLFYTGLRIGELFAVKCNEFDSTSRILKVKYQYTEFLQKEFTKHKKIRKIKINLNIYEDYIFLINVPQNDLNKLRKIYSRRLLRTSSKIFQDETKHITAHDLRHSYAMLSLKKDISISQISKVLGNSVKVCETYYVSGENDIELLNQIERKLAS